MVYNIHSYKWPLARYLLSRIFFNIENFTGYLIPKKTSTSASKSCILPWSIFGSPQKKNFCWLFYDVQFITKN